jgi:tetratricopeptide (TPR) repeat protein
MPCGGTVREVAFSPDGRWALTLGDRAQVWDLADGQPITPQLGLDRRLLAEFTPDGRRLFIISGAGDLGFLDFTPDDRPIEDLARLALILSGSRIDASGSAVPVSSSELREAHEALLARHPETFRTSVEQLRNWHLRQAERCEASRFWAGAVEHLNHLIADGPDAGALLIRRGLAHAELENVREAARDLDVHALGPVDGYYVWYRAALLHLADGDLDGYRAACAALLRHFGGPEATGDPAHFASWCCALAPDALVDYAPALALAERALAAQPSDLMAAQTVGALLHRAGRHAEAVERLEQARSLTGGTRSTPIYALLFLAMAHHRLGHAEEARHCLEEAASAIEKATLDHERGTEVLPFQRRLTLKFLRHEVTALLGLAPDTMPSGPDAFAR